MTMKPIHVATINGHPVRFFKTPNNDGKPDFAWHSSEDLMWAANIKPAMINRFMRCCKADYGDFYRTVATPDGLVTIAPHFIAQAFTTAMVEVGHVPASFVYEYQSAGFDADDKLPEKDFDGIIAAFHRHSGTIPKTGGES